jgi:tetratricopeptide (TPR) repeat protein
MKATSLLSLLFLLSPLCAQTTPAPGGTKSSSEVTPPAGDKPQLAPNQQAFLNLPEENRKEFIKHLGESNRIFQQKRIFEALEELGKAAAIFDQSPEIFNLRGSCYVEMRSFDKALEQFNKAIALSKDNPSIDFNIGEVYFVTKEWQKAEEVFTKVLTMLNQQNELKIQNNQTPDPIALPRLVEFKILLCKKKLGKEAEVKKLAEKFDFLDDSPYYYYAQAALAYEEKDLIKAEEWLARAGRIFQDANVIAPWQDTMVEYGYIKSFYGEDLGESDR